MDRGWQSHSRGLLLLPNYLRVQKPLIEFGLVQQLLVKRAAGVWGVVVVGQLASGSL